MKRATPVDIERRKRPEKAPKASQSELSLIINTIPTTRWTVYPKESTEFFNQHDLVCVRLPSQSMVSFSPGTPAGSHREERRLGS